MGPGEHFLKKLGNLIQHLQNRLGQIYLRHWQLCQHMSVGRAVLI